jgi:hypothetical protein
VDDDVNSDLNECRARESDGNVIALSVRKDDLRRSLQARSRRNAAQDGSCYSEVIAASHNALKVARLDPVLVDNLAIPVLEDLNLTDPWHLGDDSLDP